MPVSEQTYNLIQQEPRKDSILNQQQVIIPSGRLSRTDSVLEEINAYHSFSDELAVHDGMVYRGLSLVVPKTAQPEIQRRLHCSHQGAKVTATIRHAKSAVYWPRIAEKSCENVEGCVAVDLLTRQKETIKHHGHFWATRDKIENGCSHTQKQDYTDFEC